MNSGVSKAQPRRSRVRLSRQLQEQLLNAVAADLPWDHRPMSSTKRQLDEVDQPPVKKARLSDTHEPGFEGEGAKFTDKARQHTLLHDQVLMAAQLQQTPALQHPKPRPPYASFLDTFVDPVQPRSGTDSEHSLVFEWLESVGSDREIRCRSDSYLNPADDTPPRQFTRSAPAMGHRRDADGFTVPPTPVSTGSRSRADIDDNRSVAPSDATGSSSGPTGRSLVENAHYRIQNLAANNISLRLPSEELPEHISNFVNNMRKDRTSPGPSLEDVGRDPDLAALQWMGAGEPQVEEYFRTNVFPPTRTTESLQRSDRQPMAKHAVPNAGSVHKVSTPVPDMLYGYRRQSAFSLQQQTQLVSMGTEMVATNEHEGLLYPFLVIEFKGDGGSMWVATNQCLGGSASCVNIAEKLNHHLRQCNSDMVSPIGSAAFSVAMSGTEARLYISWRQNELHYYMANVDSFLLQDPEHYLKFRKYVRNIIDWGRDERLEEIRKSLDSLLDESRKRISEAAKSREPPSAADSASVSSSGSNKSRKTTSTRPKSRRSSGSQG